MLLIVIFMRFHNTNSGPAQIVERPVVSATAKTVESVNQHRVHFGHVCFFVFLALAAKLSGNSFTFSSLDLSHSLFSFSFGGGAGFTKNPELRIMVSAFP